MTLDDGRSFKGKPVDKARRNGEGRHYACFAGGHEKLAGRIAGIALRQGADHGHKTGGASLLAIAVHLKG